MSAERNGNIARRRLMIGAAGLAGIGIAGGLIYEVPRLLARRYPPTPYDDLLDQLGDRDSAAKLGRVGNAQIEAHHDVMFFDTNDIARELRTGPGKGSVARAMDADIAQGRLVEVHGWVLPISLLMVAIIAADVP